MQTCRLHARWPLLTLAMVGAVSLACTEKAASPPPLSPIPDDGDPTRPSMWALSVEVGVVRDLVTRSTPPDDQARAELARRLERIDGILGALAASGGAKHPLLEDGLDGFRADVRAARDAAAREPVDVEKIRVVTEGCKRCHVVAAREHASGSRLVRASGAQDERAQ